jgi:hypothetical protein
VFWDFGIMADKDKTILITEDNQDERRMCPPRGQLQFAANGKEAIVYLSHNLPYDQCDHFPLPSAIVSILTCRASSLSGIRVDPWLKSSFRVLGVFRGYLPSLATIL